MRYFFKLTTFVAGRLHKLTIFHHYQKIPLLFSAKTDKNALLYCWYDIR